MCSLLRTLSIFLPGIIDTSTNEPGLLYSSDIPCGQTTSQVEVVLPPHIRQASIYLIWARPEESSIGFSSNTSSVISIGSPINKTYFQSGNLSIKSHSTS